MYDIIFFRNALGELRTPWGVDGVVVARGLKTLADAEQARKLSGDIVVFHGTTDIVPDTGWLWPWEIEGKTYAYQAANR